MPSLASYGEKCKNPAFCHRFHTDSNLCCCSPEKFSKLMEVIDPEMEADFIEQEFAVS